MNDECLICGAALKYQETGSRMECGMCGKEELSKVCCINGHYVCDDCHSGGMDAVVGLCLAEKSKDPAEIMTKLMEQPFCHMHGPEHHVMVGAALLCAFKNAGGNIDLKAALREMLVRGRRLPGGICGFWGACGAGISSGIFVSIVTGSTPLETAAFGLSNRMTAKSLEKIGFAGGPRCCKRDSYLSIEAAVEFARAELGVAMELSRPVCTFYGGNNQCLGAKCPFRPV